MPTRSWTLLPPDGWKWVEYQIQDNAGNSVVYSDSIGLDTTPPVTSASHSNPSNFVSLPHTDSFSGVAATYYRIDFGPWSLYGGGSFTLSAPPPYTHTIDYYSVDFAGNTENSKQLIVHYLTVNSNIDDESLFLGGDGWYTQGVTAWTSSAPNTHTNGNTMFGFQTWKLDTAVVPGNPIGVVMSGPHWAKAGYVGLQIAEFTPDSTLDFKLRLRSEISATYNLQAFIHTPDADITYDLGSLSLPGGIEMQMPLSLPKPGGTAGSYTVELRLRDPTTGNIRAKTQITFNVP